jgi:hypothetical protein
MNDDINIINKKELLFYDSFKSSFDCCYKWY